MAASRLRALTLATLSLLATAPAQNDARASDRFQVRTEFDLAYGDLGRSQCFDLYLPVGVDQPPVVVFVHGGSWTGGSKDHYGPLGNALASRGIACAAINTRMFPTVRPDTMVVDCALAVRAVHAGARQHGYDPHKVFLMGHSSGAHLVSWLAVDDAQWRHSGVERRDLRGVIALSGVYDLRAKHPLLERVFGRNPAARAAASPLAHVGDTAPPFLVVWAERDIQGIDLMSRMLVSRMRSLGRQIESHELRGRDHVDYILELRRGDAAIVPRVVDYVRRLATPPADSGATAPLARQQVHERTGFDCGSGGPKVDVFTPEGAGDHWLVLAVDATRRGAAAALARQLAAAGIAVALVDGDHCSRLGDAAGSRALQATIQALVSRHVELRLPGTAPFAGAYGPVGWLLGALRTEVRGQLLLGAPAAATLFDGVFGTGRQLGLRAEDVKRASAAPTLLITSAGDPKETQADAAAMARLLTWPDATAFTLEGAAVDELLCSRDPSVPGLLVLAVRAFLER